MCEQYNGWTNRETWAAALWIDNDQALSEQVSNLISTAWLEDLDASDPVDGYWPGIESATASLAEWLDDFYSFDYWQAMGGLSSGAWMMIQDIGSRYRINEREIVQSWLDDEIREFKAGKYSQEVDA